MKTHFDTIPNARRGGHFRAAVLVGLALSAGGCWGEPSARELKNRQELEALLTAVSLKNPKELERGARRIGDRHAAGELSDARHEELQEIVELAREGEWALAEQRAYAVREERPYFK